MGQVKLSQITPSAVQPTFADNLVSVTTGNADTLVSIQQLGKTINSTIVTIEEFGGKADWNGSTGTDNLPAIMAAIQYNTVNNGSGQYGPKILFGTGQYYFSNTVAPLDYICTFQGIGCNNTVNGAGTEWVFPVNTLGFQTDTNSSIATTSRSASFRGSQGTIINDITFISLGGTNANAHGVRMRAVATLNRCSFFSWPGDAIHIQATAGSGGNTEGNCNDWRVTECSVNGVGNNGLAVFGNDANAGTCISFVTHGAVKGCGILDQTGVGSNTYVGCQMTGYGNTGVYNAGFNYILIDNSTGVSSTTPGTDNTIWYNIGSSGGASSQYPQWMVGNTYILTRPVQVGFGVFGQTCQFFGLYVEGAGLSHVPAPGVIYSAECASTFYSSQLTTPSVHAGPMFMQCGIGGRMDFPPGTPGRTNNGANSWSVIGSALESDATGTSGVGVFQHYRDIDGDTYTYGYDQDAGLDLIYWTGVSSKRIFGVTTAQTIQQFGRGTAQKYYFEPFDCAFRDPTVTNGGIIVGVRTTNPQTGESGNPHAAGETYINYSPSGGVYGWKCVASGTPGTFVSLGLNLGGSYTISNLPSASSVGAGTTAFVTDGNSTTVGTTYTGSGTTKCSVVTDGTNWYIG